MMLMFDPINLARMFKYVREAADAPNSGLRVEAIQKWCGGKRGDSWCCYFATMILDLCYQGLSPIPRLGACQDVYDLAKRKGWMTTTPARGDLFILVTDQDHAHHIGFVVAPNVGLAGNTNDGGSSPNGDGVYEHGLNMQAPNIRFIHYPH